MVKKALGFWNNVKSEERKFSSFYFLKYIKFFLISHVLLSLSEYIAPGRKVMTNLDSIFKNRDITLPTKVCQSRLWFFLWSCMDVRVGL